MPNDARSVLTSVLFSWGMLRSWERTSGLDRAPADQLGRWSSEGLQVLMYLPALFTLHVRARVQGL